MLSTAASHLGLVDRSPPGEGGAANAPGALAVIGGLGRMRPT
jgi:hypothetical protein